MADPQPKLPDLSVSAERTLPADAPAPATVQDYELLELIGEGGMGRVFRAIQKSTQRQVALKLLRPTLFDSASARQRFGREVRLAASLEHAHIVRVYDSGLHEGQFFYAMELVHGQPLDKFVETTGATREQVLGLMLAACRAVAFAHARGVIHRDLKPSNILVTQDGQPHVLDFGLAKASHDSEAALTLSQPDALLGTLAYMSPEQAAGREADARSDVYSLGVILYCLLTGQFPRDMTGSQYDLLRRIAEEDVRPPQEVRADLPGGLDAILRRALQRPKSLRYADAAELADDLARQLAGVPLLTWHEPVAGRLKRRFGRRTLLAASAAVGLVAAVWIGIAVWGHRGNQPNSNRPAPAPAVSPAEPPRPADGATPWGPLPDMPYGSGEARAAVLGGKLYVVGGRTGHGGETTCMPTVQMYDPAANRWKIVAPLPQARAAAGLAVVGDKLYCLGGIYEPYWWGWPSKSAFRYDPAVDRWEALAPMPTARSNFVIAVLGGKIYCAGGNIHWPDATEKVDVYDPAGDTWASAGDLPEPRADAFGGAWEGKLVVAAGLRDAHHPCDDTLVYDPAAGRWARHAEQSLEKGGRTFLFADASGIYIAFSKASAKGSAWIGRFHPPSGKIEVLAPATDFRFAVEASAYDPAANAIYMIGPPQEGKPSAPFTAIPSPMPKP